MALPEPASGPAAAGVDLEAYRVAEGLSYGDLARLIGVSTGRQAERYAKGAQWPGAEKIADIERATRGRVSVGAMHRRRLAFLRKAQSPVPHARSGSRVEPARQPTG